MNVLFYTHYWAPSVGGVETITMSLAEGLATRQPAAGEDAIHVTLVTQTAARAMDDSLLPFRVIRQPGLRSLIRAIRAADVINLAGPAFLPLLLGFLLRKPVVVEHHGYVHICPNGLLVHEPGRSVCPGHFMAGRYTECVRCNSGSQGWAKSVLSTLLTFPRRWLCQRVAGNIAVTDHVARRSELPRTRTIYYGISDLGALAPSISSGNGQQIQIGYVGRLVPLKGLPTLLRAAKELAEDCVSFHLTFIGNGAQRQELERLVDTLGLRQRVTFTGDLRGTVFLEALGVIHVVVMPSEWEETAGLAAIEHMMRGGAVIAADIGGLSEIVGDAALKFPSGDSRALASCIRRLAQDASLTSTLGFEARTRAMEIFNRDRMVREHISLYREILVHGGEAEEPKA